MRRLLSNESKKQKKTSAAECDNNHNWLSDPICGVSDYI